MEKIFLIVNPGSTSKKYALFRGMSPVADMRAGTAPAGMECVFRSGSVTETKTGPAAAYDKALPEFLEWAKNKGLLGAREEFSASGIRVVAPGTAFQTHAAIDRAYMEALRTVRETAPLHVDSLLSEIFALTDFLPALPLWGISDSAFYRGVPFTARMYAIARGDAKRFDIYRFGYHGLSVASVVGRAGELMNRDPGRTIVAHIGGGVSVVALSGRKPVAMSMGFSPLEGLPMGTRSGTIDPAAALAIGIRKHLNTNGLEAYLNKESGLLGLSGRTGDVASLLSLEKAGDNGATEALGYFVNALKASFGAYAAVLEGLDTLIFTGAVGEHAPVIRGRVCKGLSFLGIDLDEGRNQALTEGEGMISGGTARVGVWVIPTGETGEMARALISLVSR
ncbi:hypothetical protein M1555_03715 [Patescibacteria group bacterium]|nr:hypothetical protein [Patescibacteria group bacterium]